MLTSEGQISLSAKKMREKVKVTTTAFSFFFFFLHVLAMAKNCRRQKYEQKSFTFILLIPPETLISKTYKQPDDFSHEIYFFSVARVRKFCGMLILEKT